MKKVLMVATVPSMIGQFNMNNIQILLDMGYEVHVACNFEDRSVWNTARVEEFKQQLMQMNVKAIQIEFARTPYDIPKLMKVYHKLRKLICEQSYAGLHCHTPVAGMIARFAALGTETRVIYTAHGFHFFKGAPLKNWLLYYPIEKICSYMTDTLIVINQEDYALAQKKMRAKKVAYIPGVGVDLKRFSSDSIDRQVVRRNLGIPNNGFMLLSVGELNKNKNHQIVIRALAEIRNSNIYYCIAGQGSQQEIYEKLIEECHLLENVFLLGQRSDVPVLCHVADCFVHPSFREGLGIAPLEGMACGLPLISSYLHGIKDYTEDGVSGCCVDPNSLEEMVNAIRKMYENPTFRQNCAKNNKKTVQKFSLENSQKVMKQIYCENL